MNALTIKAKFVQHLSENIICKWVEKDYWEITTPFIDRHNRNDVHIRAYITKEDRVYRISDDGLISKHLKILQQRNIPYILSDQTYLTVREDEEGEFYVYADINTLGKGINTLIQAILEVIMIEPEEEY